MDPFTMLMVVGGGATALAAFGAPKKPNAKTGAQAPPPAAGRTYQLDANLPPHILSQVAGALQTSTDPVQLEALAADIEKEFPKCAAALREKKNRILAGPKPPWVGPSMGIAPAAGAVAPPATMGQPAPPAPAQAVPAPPPAPPPTATALPAQQGPSYDAGGGGSYFGPGFDPTAPTPSGVLASYPGPSAPLPAPPPAPSPARPPSSVSPATSAQRNAGRPHGYPFITLRGESTYPSKIAFQATGVEMNYPQLSAINPQFVHNGKWMNIQIGDEINIPAAWKDHLASLYHVTDASSASPAPVAAPPVEFLPPAAVPVAAPPVETVAAPPAAVVPPTPIQAIPNAEPLHFSGEATPATYKTSDGPSGSVPALASVPLSAGVATSGTYTVKKGDFPIKIAKALTGDSNRWHELIAANPTKPTKSDGNFATLMPGEVLHLPATWNTLALSGGAHAQVA